MTTVARISIAIPRRSLAGATALLLVAALLWPSPAAASTALGDLQTALCTNANASVLLTEKIDAPDGTLTIDCVAELDLNSNELIVRDVVISHGQQLTIKDGAGGGSVTADASGSSSVPGIRTSGGNLFIQGGTVTAFGGENAAGIGGGYEGSSGYTAISGGTVNATGGSDGAGIGGGHFASSAAVVISGGTVDALGGSRAAGIGGGYMGDGGMVEVGSAAVVTAAGGYTAIGSGAGSNWQGALEVAGTVHLPDGKLVIPAGAEILVTNSGQLLGGANDYTSGASIVGTGSIANHGVIALAAANVLGDGVSAGVTVSGNHYEVTFDADGGTPDLSEVTVFAPTFKAGYRDLPTEPTRGGFQFTGWADQFDGPVTVDSALPSGPAVDGSAVTVTATAQWRPAADVTTSTIIANPTSITANGTSTSTITVQAKDVNGKNLITGGDLVKLQTSDGKLSVLGDNEDGTYTATLTSSTTAGTATITGTLNTENIVATSTVTFTSASTSTPGPAPIEPEPDAPELDAPDDEDVPDSTFEDVSEDSVHAESIYRIVQYGITVGTSETTFDPSGDLARGQMSTFLVRLLMLTDPSIEEPADHEAAMALLVDKGLLLGDGNGNLDEAGTLTRGQAASLLARLVEEVTGETLTASALQFSDVATTHTHAENIAKLVESEVIHGYANNTFRSGTNLRRDQMASLLSRTINLLIASGDIEDLDA